MVVDFCLVFMCGCSFGKYLCINIHLEALRLAQIKLISLAASKCACVYAFVFINLEMILYGAHTGAVLYAIGTEVGWIIFVNIRRTRKKETHTRTHVGDGSPTLMQRERRGVYATLLTRRMNASEWVATLNKPSTSTSTIDRRGAESGESENSIQKRSPLFIRSPAPKFKTNNNQSKGENSTNAA